MTALEGPAGRVPGVGVRSRSWPPAGLVLLAAALVVGLLDVVVVPVLVQEQATDWRAYEGAAAALARGQSPYLWTVDPDIRAVTDYPYIYPPPLAAIWGFGLTATVFAMLKVLSVGVMALFARSGGIASWTPLVAGTALVGVTLASPPVLHDLVLGNVMTLYLAAVALVLALPRTPWAGIPIGVVVAVALKPAIAPFLVWMLIRRRSQFIAAFAAGLVTTALFALILGPGPFVEYLIALPKLGDLARPFSGNLGLSSISLALAVVAIPAAFGWVVWAARALDPWASAAVAIGVTFLAQPTLGLNYAGLLAPGVAVLWFIDRRAAFGMAVALPVAAVVSPPLAGVVLAVTASAVGWTRRSTETSQAIEGAKA